MKQLKIMAGIVLILAMGVFQVVAFVPPHTYSGSYWSGYLFTNAAFILQILFAFLALDKEGALKKTLLGISVFQLGFTYLVVQIFWGMFSMFIPKVNAQTAVLVSVLLLGVYLFAGIKAFSEKKTETEQETRSKDRTNLIKQLGYDMERLEGRTTDNELKQELRLLTDMLKFSDSVSDPSLEEIEKKLKETYLFLDEKVERENIEEANELCLQFERILKQRNEQCKKING